MCGICSHVLCGGVVVCDDGIVVAVVVVVVVVVVVAGRARGVGCDVGGVSYVVTTAGMTDSVLVRRCCFVYLKLTMLHDTNARS